WLATFARNRAIDRLRTGKVRSGAVAVEEAAPLPDEAPLADALMVDAERDAQIDICMFRRTFHRSRRWFALAMKTLIAGDLLILRALSMRRRQS
ncbi:MAG: hypothetical protein AAF449_09035, partial [Myxococcota bacterium]